MWSTDQAGISSARSTCQCRQKFAYFESSHNWNFQTLLLDFNTNMSTEGGSLPNCENSYVAYSNSKRVKGSIFDLDHAASKNDAVPADSICIAATGHVGKSSNCPSFAMSISQGHMKQGSWRGLVEFYLVLLNPDLFLKTYFISHWRENVPERTQA